MRLRGLFVVSCAVMALASPAAWPCLWPAPPTSVDRTLLPLPPEVPVNVRLFAMPVGFPTRVRVERDGELLTTLESEVGDVELPPLEAERDYAVFVEEPATAQRLFRTTATVDNVAPVAPTVSADVNSSGGHLDLSNSCDSGSSPFVWREARSSTRVTVDITEDAVAAVRVDDDGAVVEMSAFGDFVFRPAERADGERFALIDAAGNISAATTVDVDAAGGGCAQTSTSMAMALALVGLLLARWRRGAR
jgi:hypothetical protein